MKNNERNQVLEKRLVKEFWNEASCGENLYMKGASRKEQFINQMKKRYELEPYIIPFAGFHTVDGKRVLEIGVGLGADHQMFAENNAILYGCDLTERAIERTRERFELFNLSSNLQVADAENLPYKDDFFDVVYSWGVIHCSPDTPKAIDEIYRVIKDGGEARIMIYHKYSLVGYMLWLRYALLKFRPFCSLAEIYDQYLESPGTKAYTVKEAKELFKEFEIIEIETILSHGDLLSSDAGQRHEGPLLKGARLIYPRALFRRIFKNHGLFLLIKVKKNTSTLP